MIIAAGTALLLIDPLFINHSPLEQGGFGGLGFRGDGLSSLQGRRSSAVQGPVIPAYLNSLHRLEEISLSQLRRQAAGEKHLRVQINRPFGAENLESTPTAWLGRLLVWKFTVRVWISPLGARSSKVDLGPRASHSTTGHRRPVTHLMLFK